MATTNAEIAGCFEAIADSLEIKGANPFRVRAYRNAARTLQRLGTEVAQMLERGEDLSRLEGIGEDLAGRIAERVTPATARCWRSCARKSRPPSPRC